MSKKVAFQGALGANSEIAARRYFHNKQIACVPMTRFDQVFTAVKNGKVDFGMIPIENSLSGSIHENYDLLIKKKVWIAGEYIHHVSHHLLGLPGTKVTDIRDIVSHPQALLQCAGFIRSLKRVEAHPHFDTAGAAEFVAEKKEASLAAIASKEAAKVNRLKVLKSELEDNVENFTRFIVITANPPSRYKKGDYKTSIVFALKNLPGALHKSLSVFALRDLDLLKIESRPIPGKPWEYMFYLDYAEKYDSVQSKRALDHLQELTKSLRVLGCCIPGKGRRYNT
jgi:prephenate dehydratase